MAASDAWADVLVEKGSLGQQTSYNRQLVCNQQDLIDNQYSYVKLYGADEKPATDHADGVQDMVVFHQLVYIRKMEPLKAYTLKFKFFEANGQDKDKESRSR